MKIKKYVAASMREALIQIKEDLGDNAVILKTRKIPKNIFAIGAKDEIEVTAGIDEESSKPQTMMPLKMNNTATGIYPRPRVSNIIDESKQSTSNIHPWIPSDNNSNRSKKSLVQENLQVTGQSETKKDKQQIEELKENIQELKVLIKNIAENNSTSTPVCSFSGALAKLYTRLIDSEIKPDIATGFLKKIGPIDLMLSEAIVEKKIISSLDEQFPVTGPLRLKKEGPLIIAFVGPTGSGKTTTLAKIAAHCCINMKKKVSIITADTYRIAAIEQIRIFADIIKVELQVVFSPDEIPDAISSCNGNDLILVDTAGRCQRNNEHMDDLKEMLDVLSADETHLVLSATTKDSDLSDIVKRYRPLNVNRLIFTKLDETLKLGNVFNIVNESGMPVSYFTFGQSVPDDIELAQGCRYVQRLWGDFKK